MLIVSYKTAVISVLYIPQASNVGISFNDALMMESLKKFFFSWRGIPAIFVVWAEDLWNAGMKRRNYWWIGFENTKSCQTCSDFRSGSTNAASPINQNRINSNAAGSSCVICVELCRIRSASFGPIQKQIKAMWAQAHTAGPWDSGSRVNKSPACLSTAHPWGRGGHEPLNNDWYSNRDWTEAGLSKILLHLACFNRLLTRKGSQTLSSVLRLRWHLRLLRLCNVSIVAVHTLI